MADCTSPSRAWQTGTRTAMAMVPVSASRRTTAQSQCPNCHLASRRVAPSSLQPPSRCSRARSSRRCRTGSAWLAQMASTTTMAETAATTARKRNSESASRDARAARSHRCACRARLRQLQPWQLHLCICNHALRPWYGPALQAHNIIDI